MFGLNAHEFWLSRLPKIGLLLQELDDLEEVWVPGNVRCQETCVVDSTAPPCGDRLVGVAPWSASRHLDSPVTASNHQ